MELYKFFPIPSDRMGTLWTLSTIADIFIIEFGPAGTTHFAQEGMMQLNGSHKANVYTTHIDETDISFGTHERLEKAIIEIDENHHPKYIFIMASSISAVIGTDIESVCYEMQPRVKARLIPITTGGYHGDHTLGIEKTLKLLCQQLVPKNQPTRKNHYGLIGTNVDQFNFLSDAEEIKAIMEDGFGVHCSTLFTAYTTLSEIEAAGQAEFNLLLRAEGIKAAKELQDNHGIPYHHGRPYGLAGTVSWIRAIEGAFKKRVDEGYLNQWISRIKRHLMSYQFMLREKDIKDVALIGDYDTVIGLADFMEELGLRVNKIIVKHKLSAEIKDQVPEKWQPFLVSQWSEAEIEEYLKETPLYLLMADGASLEFKHQSRLTMQIANPNLLKHTIYPYTPFVGFKGALYLIQCLFELDKARELGKKY